MAAKARSADMPKWQPAPTELVEHFGRAVDDLLAVVESRKMFGYPAVFLNGNMFAGLFQDRVILRLSADDRAELAKLPGAAPFEPMPGRRMREYMVAPASVVDSGPQLRAWLQRARSFAASLPKKESAGKTAKKTSVAKRRR